MKKKWMIGLTLALLIGCTGDEAEEEVDSEETVEVEDAEETTDVLDENEEDEIEEEEEEQVVMPDPVHFESTIYSFETNQEETILADVGPILVEEDYAVLPIVFDTESEHELSLSDFLGSGAVVADNTNNQHDIRLIDPYQQTVSHIGMFSWEHDVFTFDMHTTLSTFRSEVSEAESTRNTIGGEAYEIHLFTIFGAPSSEEVHVFLGKLGFVENVPVVDRDETTVPTLSEVEERFSEEEEEPEAADRVASDEHFIYGVPTLLEVIERVESSSAVVDDPSDHIENITYRTLPLETYRESLETTVRRVDEVDFSTIILSSDVLFDFDSAELTEEADAELEAAIAELEGVEGGELQIVGHTDNEHTEEYNQELSEDRAESVYTRLDELADLELFDEVNTSGESFREPIADNDSEEGRALNRRVELHFTPPTEQIVIESENELPEADGVEVQYPELADTQFGSIEVESLEQVDNFFVGRIKVHENEGKLDRLALQQRRQYRNYAARSMPPVSMLVDGYESVLRVEAITLLHNGQRYYPLDYYMTPLPGADVEEILTGDEEDEGEDYIVPLAERFLQNNYNPEEGAYYYATVVWPALDTDEVAVDLHFPPMPENANEDIVESELERLAPWRILGVPVE